MPLRRFSIGPVGEEVYPRFVEELAERFDDSSLDRNVVAREALTRLYLGRDVAWEEAVADASSPLAFRALAASFDPRKATLAERVFRRCGRDVRIFHDVEFSFGYNLSVGNGVTIHRNVLIDDRGEVVIGDDASISDYVNIYSHAHAVEDIHDVSLGRTVIGDRVRITYHAVVLSGVEIQADAMVGSMGVASKPVAAGVIAAGIPAKPIGQKRARTKD